MSQKDYILRMIEQLSVILMKIIFNKEIQNYAQALSEIDCAYTNLLGFDPKQIKNMTEDEIIDMLKSNGILDAEKSIIIAELLREEAEIKELENGFDGTVFTTVLKSFCLYIEAIKNDSGYNQKNYINKIDKIVRKIMKYELPTHITFKLFQYYELIGCFGKAEDILYELIDLKYSDILDEGKFFYKRLMEKSDDELLDGNLPRDEVQEGLAQIEKKSI